MKISVEIDGWTVLPIADQGVTTHLIATRDDDEALFTDIDVVLYERLDDGWSATAYDPQVTKEDAMVDLASEFGLADPHDGDWWIDLDEEDYLDYILPRVPFGKGFFVTDPLHDIAQFLDDAEPLAEGAEDSGLAAGSSAINTGSITGTPIGGGGDVGGPQPGGGGEDCGCEDACIQESILIGTNAYLADQSLDAEAVEAIAYDYLQTALACCIPHTWRVGPVTKSCSPVGGWAFAGSRNQSIAGGRRLTCDYTRTVVETKTRKCIKRCFDCTKLPHTQVSLRTGTQTTSISIDYQGVVPPCPPPGSPLCAVTDGTTWGPWGPPPPTCP